MERIKILVIRFSSIGDIVLTTPVVRRLKNQLDEEVEIHYLTKKQFAPLILSNPNVDVVHTIEKATAEVIEDLKSQGFAYVIDLHKNVRSAMVKKGLKQLSFTLEKLNWQKWLLVNLGIDRLPNKHIVDRYLDTIKAFGTKDDNRGLELVIAQEDQIDLSKLGMDFSDGYIALAIGGAHEGKRLPAERWPAILDNLPLPVVIVGDSIDRIPAELILKNTNRPAYNACGEFSIMQSASVVEQSRLVISGDTGMMHISSAFGKDIVSLWGCTVPNFGIGPYRAGAKTVIIEPQGLNKRPCSKLGNRCKYGREKRCITHIQDQAIVEAVSRVIN
jgi:ADP-heptose:LPS heptosyltransferase